MFKRSGGGNWKLADSIGNKGYVPHPVKKNGLFDFEPRKYGYNNLLAIQKDNQNTVTISTVNKIGLSNTQRFYYLYKATENVLKSNWPVCDVVLNRIEGFEAFASVLNYQGFSVDSAYDVIFTGGDIGSGTRLRMEGVPNGTQDMNFSSHQRMESLPDGQYAWQFKAYATNNATGDLDTTKFYNALFSIDRVAPKFSLNTENDFVNPDSANVLVRYKWTGAGTPDVRAMRWTLEKDCSMKPSDTLASMAVCTEMLDLPAMYDVAATEFSLPWSKVPQGVRDSLDDGLYRIKAYALDYAVPNRAMYDSVNALVGRIMQNPSVLGDASWKFVRDSSDILNDTTVYALFHIDRTAPLIKNILSKAVYAADTAGMSFATGMVQANPYADLPRPKNIKEYPIVGEDSLLEISYKVVERNSGIDTSAVAVSWSFEHVDDTKNVGRAGDSVRVTGDSVNVVWKEMTGLRLADGVYRIRAMARDVAWNRSDTVAPKLVRIDRTAPKIVSLVSGHSVYSEGDKNFFATIEVNEKNDVDFNRTGMYCHYRVLGGDADNSWRAILRNGRDSLLATDSIKFDMDTLAVGTQNGKRYLEVACIDAAGNASVRTDLFHVGYRSPNIVYPVADETESSENLIPIVGIAPPFSLRDSLNAVYRLRYKKCADTTWLDDKIDVVAANRRSDSLHNYSRVAQSVEGVLGYLKNENLGEDSVCIELAVASCLGCDDWKTDISKVVVSPYEEDSLNVRPTVVFDVSRKSFVAGRDSVSVSLRLEGTFNSSYLLRVYAEDADGVGLKDWSAEKVWRNPYYGLPKDSLVNAEPSGVWFYQDSAGIYHLQWKNIGDSLKLQVLYDSSSVKEACEGPNGNNVDAGCSVESMTIDFGAVAEASKTYLEDYPEWTMPPHVDKVMKFSLPSGHVVVDATSAFRISVDGNCGASKNCEKVPVYFGNSNQSGFYWVRGLDELQLSPLSTGWSVNPQGYGLNFAWNGLSETNAFPAEGTMKLVAEVTENTTKSPHVYVETKNVNVELPALEVTLATSLPDFLVLNKDIDNGDSVAFCLDSMEIRYGIKNKDAKVWVYVKDSEGNVVTTLLDGAGHRAYASDSAYSVRWSGKNAFDTPETAEGTYSVYVKAEPNDGSEPASAMAIFNVKYADAMQKMTPDDPKKSNGPSIYVSEAKKDNLSGGKYRYEPVADYLLHANLSGWYLPDSLRDSLKVKAVARGKQKPIGFDAENFSLGILRQRDTLDLVILLVLNAQTDDEEFDYDGSVQLMKKYSLKFIHSSDSLESEKSITFTDSLGYIFSDKVFSINEESSLHLYAFPKYRENEKEDSLLKDSANSYFHESISLPKPQKLARQDSEDTLFWNYSTDNDEGCVADSNNTCSYSKDEYNYNADLLKLKLYPFDGEYYSETVWTHYPETPSSGHGNGLSAINHPVGFRRIDFGVTIKIPQMYWKAGFGYDNLVNRTIHFDATNSTIYGESSGYLLAIENEEKLANESRRNTYYDGFQWKFDKKYGRVTAFETQHLPFFKASQMDVATNTFLFPDEIPGYENPSRFTVKFYGKDAESHFVADVFAKKVDGSSYSEHLTSLVEDSLQTPMLKHGDMDFYVSFNKVVPETDKFFGNTAEYWMDFPLDRDEVPVNNDTLKYYAAASRIHYFVDDYADSIWLEKFSNGTYFKNLSNTALSSVNLINSTLNVNPASVEELGLNDSLFTLNEAVHFITRMDPEKYDASTHRFFTALGIDANGVPGLSYSLDYVLDGLDSSSYSHLNDTLFVNAREWSENEALRRTEYNLEIPDRFSPVNVEMDKLFDANSWEKEVVVNDVDLTFLDSSVHSRFEAKGNFPAASDIEVLYKNEVGDWRISEFVELRAYLKAGEKYSLAYLNGNKFYVVPDSSLDSSWKNGIVPKESGDYRLGWFNVNKLQGNTQFLLTWGGERNNSAYYYSTFDMLVGKAVEMGKAMTVVSPLENASVVFVENSLSEDKDVTVRTVDAGDYPFEVFNKLALNGPIVEVLPSMTFENKSALPRVQMKISRDEMNAMNATPQTVRLYKVDFASRKFVSLDNALYGFLRADGSPVMDGTDTLKCDYGNKMTDVRCAGNDTLWAYLLISAETRTFSVFTALDSTIAETPSFGIAILPEIAETYNRTVRIDGLVKFKLYVDDDSLWANHDDSTPPVALSFTADSNGFAQITLPSRGKDVDSSYVFVVALSESDTTGVSRELPAAPAVVRALTVNAQFACSVPSDSLWLGLDNGYMAYGASCTHPGYGLVSLNKDGRVVAEIRGEIPDTVIYDGSKMTGASRMGKIASGVYESRYVGVSALGMDMQLTGPRVYTDSARPVIENFSIRDSSEVLDRVFTATADVYDFESGVARVVVTPVFGDDTLRAVNTQPDSAGHVSASVRISRKQLSECVGCYLSMEIRAEDFGRNHAEQKSASEKLYPYPTKLALWYPARESSGNIAHELLGTGHDLSLFMQNPWGSDAGLYFGNRNDYAVGGNDVVNFGSSPSYSFEARVKNGSSYSTWRRLLGFKGVNGLDIELTQRDRVLKLREGEYSWESSPLPLVEKSWSHVVVTVDSVYVKFYVDGELVKTNDAVITQERELEGVFSMGQADGVFSYLGNIADIRMYSRALTAAEVEELSKPVTDAGEVSDVIVVAVNDMEAVSGFSNEFSCSVSGNKYLVSDDLATLTMSVIVENAAEYNVVLYARSATAGEKQIRVGEVDLLMGTASISNTWRAEAVSGVSVHLSAGTHTLTLKVPAGVQIGGVALTTANIPASMIAWGASTSDKVAGIEPADTARKVKSYLRYEGFPETSTLRPRIRLKNVSGEPINGFSVRYYFRGEDASQAKVDRYWPNENVSTFPAVYSESANTGYVEWKFTETIPVAGTVFGGDGPHFGLYNADYTPWDASDDPSFIDPNSGLSVNVEGFYEDAGVIVLDSDNNLIGGSCAEMEDPVSLETKARVLAADVRGDNQASEIHIKVENTGNVALKNFDVRYYFFLEEGLAPDYEIYDKSECTSASMESLGSGRWQLTVHCDKPLAAGKSWQNPVKVALHLSGWAAMWNVNDDPSHDSLESTMREARGICVSDSTGYMLYGNSPTWFLPASDEGSPDSVYNVDFGYKAPDNSIPVVRTPDGLVLTLDSWVYVELGLVTAMGTPVKSVFNGTLAPGEQLVRVDWTGIDMGRTYLMLKVNGSIKSTKKLSLL
ncbi:LamG-like jellyroll fold domain-containing protein [Fibrobacter sp.]|uniref:LamG-like jellyroll fold domain-containing protein n=1 Tax=Fibrobacter sp. TaxID=35828 RepID=UPI0038906988